MPIRSNLVQQLVFLFAMVQLGFAQDLTQEADAAKKLLRQRQLAESKSLVDKLIVEEKWRRNSWVVSHLFGKTFDDPLVQPLITFARRDLDPSRQRLLWHAIGYTQTAAGDAFLQERRRNGSDREKELALACIAAAKLRQLKAQCDLDSNGYVTNVYFSSVDRKLTAEDTQWLAYLPSVKIVSIGDPARDALEPLRRVTTLDFVGLTCDAPHIDDAIACLTNSKGLSVLNLRGPVTDRAMPSIGTFSSLGCLRLNGSRITDEGLSHLRTLTQLSHLELADTAITDKGLQHLSELKELTNLTLSGTQVSGAGLVHLGGMENLWALNLVGTNIDDWSLGTFQEFPGLQSLHFLYLDETRVSNAGLSQLAELKNLRGLSLGGNERITSQGLQHLHVLPNLDWITCRGGSISHAAAEAFCAGRPDSFYISYTTEPGGPIRQEQARTVNLNRSPTAEWIKKLRRPNSSGDVPEAVIKQIAARGPDVIEPLLHAVKQQRGISRDAADVLYRLGPQVLDTLVQQVREDSSSRQTVARVFYLHGDAVVPRLRTMLSDDHQDVRFVAMEALYAWLFRPGINIPSGLDQELIRCLKDTNADVRHRAVQVMRRFPENFTSIASTLQGIAASDPDLSTRMAAVTALGRGAVELASDDPLFQQVVGRIDGLADDKEFYVREASIHALSKLAKRDERAMKALVRATADKREPNRRLALDLLRSLGVNIE